MDARIGATCADVARKAYSQLLPNEQAILTRFQSESSVQNHVVALLRAQSVSPLIKVQGRIDKILRLLKPISLTFRDEANGSYAPSKFLWGIFGSVVDVNQIETVFDSC